MKIQAIWNVFQAVIAAVGAFLGWFVGGLDGLIYVLIVFALCDYATGVASAFVRKELSSEIGAKGIAKKVVMFTIVGVGHLVDAYMLGGNALRTAILFWYIANEGLSIIENAVILGVPVPGILRDALVQIRKKSDGRSDDEKGE